MIIIGIDMEALWRRDKGREKTGHKKCEYEYGEECRKSAGRNKDKLRSDGKGL